MKIKQILANVIKTPRCSNRFIGQVSLCEGKFMTRPIIELISRGERYDTRLGIASES